MNIKLIETGQDIPGFNGFMGSWLCQDKYNFLVDTCPSNTSKQLINSLESLGLTRIDYILLTHIHIDHAGALADLLEHYPMAKVVCHQKGIKFLVEPSQLWTGSLNVLGQTARIYGIPKPVNAERLIPHLNFEMADLVIIETPGHAAHHLSFDYKGILFAGEAGGNYFRINNEEYLRPATPPRFFFELFLKSLDHLLALDNQTICYAHFGRAENSHLLLSRFRNQLFRWKDIIFEQVMESDENLLDRCMDALLKNDPEINLFNKMEPECQKREKIFLANSIKGFIDFFREDKN